MKDFKAKITPMLEILEILKCVKIIQTHARETANN